MLSVYKEISSRGLEYFKGKRVLLQGLGINKGGLAVAQTMAPLAAELRITDLRTADQLKPSLDALEPYIRRFNIRLILGQHREQDFKWADIVFKNPGVPFDNHYIQIAKDRGVPILTEVGAFMLLWQKPVIGVTGTKGKSTTTALIHHILSSFEPTLLGGNIGVPVLTELKEVDKYYGAVLEIPSFVGENLLNMGVAPQVSVMTNLLVDHLNWHKTMDHYAFSKFALFMNRPDTDWGIINLDSDRLIRYLVRFKDKTKGRFIGVTLGRYGASVRALRDRLGLEDVVTVTDEGQFVSLSWLNRESIRFLKPKFVTGSHLLLSLGLAVIAAQLYTGGKYPLDNLVEATKDFSGLPGRQEFVRTINGIDFYNDTAATVQDAVIVAVERFAKEYDGKVILIAGGMDKGTDYSLLASALNGKIYALVLLEGSASEKLYKEAGKLGLKVYAFFDSMQKAVEKAYALALSITKQEGQGRVAVVLSPGAASFNMFLNEWDRGEQYTQAVTNLSK